MIKSSKKEFSIGCNNTVKEIEFAINNYKSIIESQNPCRKGRGSLSINADG